MLSTKPQFSTEVPNGWSVLHLEPNVDGKLVGKQRKPRPFLLTYEPAASCEAAYDREAELAKSGLEGFADMNLAVRYNGEQFYQFSACWPEYQAMCARRNAEGLV